MPLYEFTCTKCGKVFEELLSLAELEAGDLECPTCGAREVTRDLSTFATSGGEGGGGCRGGGCGTGGFA
ncbi:MAG: zinc ribbon domain-containing protein [bacterium]|jgi:putative FmdB family regulatory protein|nr:zinc ribbon domain-containing protein [bacterium]MBK7045246.1 zinc ribbon domain-containing protein [bacterium]MBK7187819.1 zinc ribbon domain-containing protein [bacterium]MBK7672278.1 zinc ribbon domain-containing protein [bacterium]MBK9775829.1 zinc ribbon domain-containing protein [bacterium]